MDLDHSAITHPSFARTRESKPQEGVQTTRWQPYPDYRDSGVEWLGQVPAHWEVKRLKYVATVNYDSLPETTSDDEEILYVDITNVDAIEGIVSKEPLTFGQAPSRARRCVQDGDVIFSTVRTYLRAIAPVVAPEPNLVVSTGFAVIRPARKLAESFGAYVLTAPYLVDYVVAHSEGVSYPAITANELMTLPLALPPLPEQRAIAAFLDRETARIDDLVAAVEQAIERLREYRTALISWAVTGRINVLQEAHHDP